MKIKEFSANAKPPMETSLESPNQPIASKGRSSGAPSQPISIEQLDNDCLAIILSWISFRELLTSLIKCVSKKFAKCTELALTKLNVASPCELSVNGCCEHIGSLQNEIEVGAVPRLFLAGVPVTKPEELAANSKLLASVVELSLSEAFCDQLPLDYLRQLQAIMRQLSGVQQVELCLKANQHYQEDSATRPFLQATVGALCMIPTLKVLKLVSSVPRLAIAAVNQYDFARSLAWMERLVDLILPSSLFVNTPRLAPLRLACLQRLDLLTDLPDLNCQQIVGIVADYCDALCSFTYNCTVEATDHVCVSDTQPLGKLQQLVQLHLAMPDLRSANRIFLQRPGRATWTLLKDLTLDFAERNEVIELMALIRMAPNVENLRIHLTDDLDLAKFFRELMQLRQEPSLHLAQLRCLQLNCFVQNLGVYQHISSLTANSLPSMVHPLRQLKIIDWTYSCDVDLLHSYEKEDDPRRITYAIASAKNIHSLTVCLKWVASYLHLKRLLAAMQRGSIQLLIVKVVWAGTVDETPMEPRLVTPILPANCSIWHWHLPYPETDDPSSIWIVGEKLEGVATIDGSRRFWVHIEDSGLR